MAEQHGLTGYRRENGTVGIRNHTVILPVDDLSNAAAEAVAKVVPGTLALPHAYGRLQFGEDLELTFRTLIGTGRNPNVGSVVVIGIEPNWTNRVVEGIAKTGKRVEGLAIEGVGDLRTIERASRIAQRFLQEDSERGRERVERGEIMLSIKCGESDTTSGLGSCPTTAEAVDRWVDAGGTVLFGETSELTGGEHLIADRCVNDEVRARFQGIYDDYLAMIERTGANLLGSQPTQGNIAGGLSTIEEKAMGNIAKTGSKPVIGALGPAEEPESGPGLYFMDTSSAAAECITLMAAAARRSTCSPRARATSSATPSSR
nr:UxaA family hydrolase [Actinomadura madurae]